MTRACPAPKFCTISDWRFRLEFPGLAVACSGPDAVVCDCERAGEFRDELAAPADKHGGAAEQGRFRAYTRRATVALIWEVVFRYWAIPARERGS